MNKVEFYSLEYYVSLGCVNCCVGCSHGAPIRKGLIDIGTFKVDVERMAKIVKIRRFALSGGEPLLHPQIEELIEIAKFLDIAKEIMVLTNGLLLDKQPESFWEKLDVLRVSRYPGQLKDKQIKEWKSHAEHYGAEFLCLDIPKFYKPFFNKPREEEDIIDLFKNCPYYNKCSAIYNGWYYPCSQASFYPEIVGLSKNMDGLLIETLTPEKLVQESQKDIPLVSCHKCSYKQEFSWKQTTKEKWLEDSTENEV